jgi:hypothetical protein
MSQLAFIIKGMQLDNRISEKAIDLDYHIGTSGKFLAYLA